MSVHQIVSALMQHCDPKDQILSKLPTLTVDLSVLNVTKLGWTGFHG